MVKPKSSNRSIRLTDEMWAWLNAEAERRQSSVNGVVAELLIIAARLRADDRAAGWDPRPAPEMPALVPTTERLQVGGKEVEVRGFTTAKINVPLAGTFQRGPMQKKGKK